MNEPELNPRTGHAYGMGWEFDPPKPDEPRGKAVSECNHLADTPTTTSLLSPEQAEQDYLLLRRTIGMALGTGSRKHDWRHTKGQWFRCTKCGLEGEKHNKAIFTPSSIHGCSVPSPDGREMAVLAEQLLRKCLVDDEMIGRLGDAITVMFLSMTSTVWRSRHFIAFLKATPEERAICALLALKLAVVG